MKNSDLAPIAIFIYNREHHTRRLLQSLLCSPLFHESSVTIYCDAPKCAADEEGVSRTCKLAKDLVPQATFVERDENLGLAKSIIAGVSEQCDRHGRTIVIEDDLVFSRFALPYFNAALDHYKYDDRVMHVAGYMYPVRRPLPDAFFYRETTCWGWATWKRAWTHFEPDAWKSIDWLRANEKVHEFNVRNSLFNSLHFDQMLDMQCEGKLDSWAVRWYASVFRRGGLALHPGIALVANRGHDGSGVHCRPTREFDVFLARRPLDRTAFPSEVVESAEALEAIIDFRANIPQTRLAVATRKVTLLARYLRRLITSS